MGAGRKRKDGCRKEEERNLKVDSSKLSYL